MLEIEGQVSPPASWVVEAPHTQYRVPREKHVLGGGKGGGGPVSANAFSHERNVRPIIRGSVVTFSHLFLSSLS